MIKAIFFDIDGTLISYETHLVPESTKRAIELLRKKDIKVFIATGRSLDQVVGMDDIYFDGFVTLNGSYCVSHDHQLIYKSSIPQEDIRSLLDYLKENPFPCSFSTGESLFINYYDDVVEKVLKTVEIPRFPIKDINEALHQDIFQISAFMNRNGAKEILNRVLPQCDATSWHPVFMDVVAMGNSKQVGIDKVLEYYGLNLSEAMCFGDGGNDIPMLMHTPISVAMGNANDEVKKHATHVTDSVDDDGVWNALKRLDII